jgi:hypothetical protein
MRLTFLGKSTQGGGSPTLYRTDRDTYVVQGWCVAGESPTVVEIPESLLRYLEPGAGLAASLRSTGRRWYGDGGEWPTYTLSGTAVTDRDVLDQMNVPEHERCVEVERTRKDHGAPAARSSL